MYKRQAFGGERKIPFFGTWRIEREVIIPELTPELTSGMPLEEAMFVTTDFIGYELEYTGEYYREGEPTSRYPNNPVLQERTTEAVSYTHLETVCLWSGYCDHKFNCFLCSLKRYGE